MKRILRVLTQILLVNLLFLTFLFYNKAYSKIFDCNSYSIESLELEDNNYPISFEVVIPNSKKWITRVLKSMGGDRIDKKYKKYQKSKIIVTFSNNSKCEYWGKVRIHGSTKSHINIENLNPSLRIIIEDGHINNKYNFALINKKSLPFEEEIFVSTFFEHLGYLAPSTFITTVKINDNPIENYLFYEIPTLEMSKDKKRNNGIFLMSNKNNFANAKTSYTFRRSIILNRIKNSDGISSNNNLVKFYAIDKLNYIFLNSLGIGDGKNCCNNFTEDNKDKIEKNYNKGIYSLNFSYLDDGKEIEKISIFNLLMNAVNAQHGLALEDRSFFYNPMFDQLEPVYRDGDPKIVNDNGFNPDDIQLFEYEKKFIKKAILKIKTINIEKFQESLNKKRLKISKNEINIILNQIKNNLLKINDLNLSTSHENIFASNYFNKHFDKNLSLNLVFGGKDNRFEICNIKLDNCKTTILDSVNTDKLLKDKFLNIENFNKDLYYVRFSKNDYILNLKPKKRGIKSFNKIEIDDDQYVYLNSKKNSIFIDHQSKTINLKQNDLNDKFVFIVDNFNDWNINFIGSEKYSNTYTLHKRDINMIGGCITFVDSIISDISVKMYKNTCGKGLEILNTKGSFKKIEINDSKLDAFDSEFSNLTIDEVIINGAYGGECIGLKRGKYVIKKANLYDCGDHSVSVGEHSELRLETVTGVNARRIMAKDSSFIEIFDYTNLDSNECLLILRKKKQFNGAYIKVKKDNLKCMNKKITKDKFSNFNYF